MRAHPHKAVEWVVSPGLVSYETALAVMAQRIEGIAAGREPELVWLLEHPPLYTAGTSADPAELLDAARFPVHSTGRGGRYTYHGPGQRIGYVMLDVGARFGDVRAYVAALEGLVMDTLAGLGVESRTISGRVGVWVARDPAASAEEYEKVAAVGVRLRRWVSSHGFSINVAPDLEHFAGIVPCGIADAGVTSLARLGVDARMDVVDAAVRAAFEQRFGPTSDAPPGSLQVAAGLPLVAAK
jgi:lipoyl(octanoyl) transferase